MIKKIFQILAIILIAGVVALANLYIINLSPLHGLPVILAVFIVIVIILFMNNHKNIMLLINMISMHHQFLTKKYQKRSKKND